MTATLTGTASKVYDGTTTASLAGSNFSYSGRVGSDDVTVSPSSGTYASANVGTGIGVTATGLTLTGAAAGNYSLAQSTASAAVGEISARSITVTADPITRKYGDANPTLTYSYSGLVNNDVLTGSLLTAATQNSNVGVYAITLGSLTGGNNYKISYSPQQPEHHEGTAHRHREIRQQNIR